MKSVSIPINDLVLLIKSDKNTLKEYEYKYIISNTKTCKNCGKSFFNIYRDDALYCFDCKKYGSIIQYKQKLGNSEILKIRYREYQRRYGNLRYLKEDERKIKICELREFLRHIDNFIKTNPSIKELEQWIKDNK